MSGSRGLGGVLGTVAERETSLLERADADIPLLEAAASIALIAYADLDVGTVIGRVGSLSDSKSESNTP